MRIGSTFINQLLAHIFQNADVTLIGDAGGLLQSVADGNLHVGLHTAYPGAAGTQATSEATFTSYARIPVPRTVLGWDVTANVASNVDPVTFVACTGGSNQIRFWSIGTDLAGAGKLLFSGHIGEALHAFAIAEDGSDFEVEGAHGLAADDEVVVFSDGDAALPGSLTEGGVYTVNTVEGDIVTLSRVAGYAPLTVRSGGRGLIAKLNTLTVENTVVVELDAGAVAVTVPGAV